MTVGSEGHVKFFGLVLFERTFGNLLYNLSYAISVATSHMKLLSA